MKIKIKRLTEEEFDRAKDDRFLHDLARDDEGLGSRERFDKRWDEDLRIHSAYHKYDGINIDLLSKEGQKVFIELRDWTIKFIKLCKKEGIYWKWALLKRGGYSIDAIEFCEQLANSDNLEGVCKPTSDSLKKRRRR